MERVWLNQIYEQVKYEVEYFKCIILTKKT